MKRLLLIFCIMLLLPSCSVSPEDSVSYPLNFCGSYHTQLQDNDFSFDIISVNEKGAVVKFTEPDFLNDYQFTFSSEAVSISGSELKLNYDVITTPFDDFYKLIKAVEDQELSFLSRDNLLVSDVKVGESVGSLYINPTDSAVVKIEINNTVFYKEVSE